ncbi:MAG: hypothetical protein HKN70_02695 [Gammaproteobacteria bacterium]|nr:hypothetical protein [Gammaproteobacteria bacterium]
MTLKNRILFLHRLLATAVMIFVAPALLAANLIIDDFSTNQGPLNVSPALGPLTDSSSASGAGILGGSRDLVLSTDSGSSVFSSSAQVAGGVAQLADNSQFSSDLLFQWDGADNAALALDTTGLAGIDLTTGSNNAFELGLVFDDLPATLQFNVYSTDGSASTVTFPGTGLIFTDLSILVPFASFTGGADFTDVGAIELLISSPTNGLDISFDFLQTNVAPVPVPSAVFFMGSALFGLGLLDRRTDSE